MMQSEFRDYFETIPRMFASNYLTLLVGAGRFELPTPSPPGWKSPLRQPANDNGAEAIPVDPRILTIA